MAPTEPKKQSKRRTKSTTGSDNKSFVDVETVDKTDKNVEKAVKHSKKRVCPCNQSLGVYWLIQCSNKLCNQGWHTRCANVPGTMNEEVVNKLTNDGWLCPWCFSCPFPRPANHPVAKNDLTCIVASTATQICEAVRKNITTDASCLKEELNEMYKAVSIDQNAISEEISESLKSMKTMLEESKSLLKDAAILKSSPGHSTSNPGTYQVTNISIPSEPDLPLVQSSTDKHYTCIKTDVLDQETYDATMNFLVEEEANFSAVSNSRKVLYFGDHAYKYSKSHHKASPIPEKLQDLMNCLKSKMPEMSGNSLLITCYDSGKDFCPTHKDDETWINPASDIYTLSLGAERTMRFTHEDTDKEQIDVSLPDNSLLTFSRKSQEFWKHAITADESISLKRYSITIRDPRKHATAALKTYLSTTRL